MKRDNRHRKTWSYWNTYQHPFEHLQAYSNSSLVVKTPHKQHLIVINITTLQLTQMILITLFSELEQSENIDIIFETNIEDIGLEGTEYIFRVSENLDCKARYVFDSRPNNHPFV